MEYSLKKYLSTKKVAIGLIKEDDLSGNLIGVLKNTKEGHFSRPISRGTSYTVYHVKKRTFAESNFYRKKKTEIHNLLFEKEAKKILLHWIDREREKHYVKKI